MREVTGSSPVPPTSCTGPRPEEILIPVDKLNPTMWVTLRQLQDIDTQIWHKEQRQARIPEEMAAAQDAFDQEAAAVKAAHERLTTCQVQHKSKEGELAAKEEQVKKSQGRLFKLKTNKEYTAMQHEIAGMKADMSVLEDDILAILEQTDAAQQHVKAEQALLAQKEAALKTAQRELAAESQQLQQALTTFAAKRAALVGHMPASILGTYERILRNRQGVALARVSSAACGGCNMRVPPQVQHELRAGERLVTCENCARILYWDDTGE